MPDKISGLVYRQWVGILAWHEKTASVILKVLQLELLCGCSKRAACVRANLLHLLCGPTIDSDYLILPPAVSPKTTRHRAKQGNKKGRETSNWLGSVFLPSQSPGGPKEGWKCNRVLALGSFPTCLSTFSHSCLSSSTRPLTIPPLHLLTSRTPAAFLQSGAGTFTYDPSE